MKTIKILLFDGVELLDFAGPLEVFSVASYLQDEPVLHVSTIAFKNEIQVSKTGLRIIPNEIASANPTDLLIIPGGIGTRYIVKEEEELGQINKLIQNSEMTASVCTGALILGKLGYLKSLKATTHHLGIEDLRALDPSIQIDANERFIDNGQILTSAGISAGIDMSLHLVERFFSKELREDVESYMEYEGN